MGEDRRRHSFSAFHLYFQKLQCNAVAAHSENAAIVNERTGDMNALVARKARAPKMNRLATQNGPGTRPGLQTANVVVNFGRGLLPLNAAIFLLQNRCPGGTRGILWGRA